jgi:hypothetical protein
MYQDQESLINAVQEDWDAAHQDAEALFQAQLVDEMSLKSSIENEANEELINYSREKLVADGDFFIRIKSQCESYTYIFDASDTSIILHALYFPLSNDHSYLIPERIEREAIDMLRKRIK